MAKRIVLLLLAVMLVTSLAACVDRTVELGTTNLDDLTLEGALVAGTSVTAGTTVSAADLAATDDLTVADDLTVSGSTNAAVGQENVGTVTSYVTATVAYDSSGAVFTVTDGEIWLVQDIEVEVTANWDCTGDDCTLTLGDGNDADGLCVLADANLQAAATEGTGWPAGFTCKVAATRGVYMDEVAAFRYAPSGADETLDITVGGTSPAAGTATVHLYYMRLQ